MSEKSVKKKTIDDISPIVIGKNKPLNSSTPLENDDDK